jgi:uncharacterized repeat protein (TIGR03803 family)
MKVITRLDLLRLTLSVAALAFVLASSASASDTEVVLHTFTGTPDAAYPAAGLIADAPGNLYGTTQSGGTAGWGTAYKLSPNGAGWSESILYSFDGQSDGRFPFARLIFDGSGNLYGTTESGGNMSGCNGTGCGTVFKLTHSGSAWTEHVLYTFTGGADGAIPFAGVISDSSGNLYGTASEGGNPACTGGCGVVFKLTPSVMGSWTESVLYSFRGGTPGAQPSTGLVFDSSGNLYGTTYAGGNQGPNCSGSGCGVVFELLHQGMTWTQKVLLGFTGGADGANPTGGLTIDANGNLYGPAGGGGANHFGLVFKLTHVSSAWTEYVLHAFSGGALGGFPSAALSFDAAGNLYGPAGGGNDCVVGRHHDMCGIIYKLTRPPIGNTWSETVLYSFFRSSGGWLPNGDLLVDGSGDVFGTTNRGTSSIGCCGVVFKLVPGQRQRSW